MLIVEFEWDDGNVAHLAERGLDATDVDGMLASRITALKNETFMSDKSRGADYHNAHLDDPEEWDKSTPEDVTPRPSGMTVLSLRLPTDEFDFLKREADVRKTTMSELMRSALRFYLFPRASGSLSATAIHKLQVTTMTPTWMGGLVEPRAEVEVTYTHVKPLNGIDGRPAAAKP